MEPRAASLESVLAALRDDQLGRAIAAIHREPGADWTCSENRVWMESTTSRAGGSWTRPWPSVPAGPRSD